MPTLSALTRCDFYPRSPCGERLPTRETYLDIVAFLSTLSLRRATCIRTQTALPVPISIHALLAESDQLQYSTGLATIISIHALLAESDASILTGSSTICYFYPRSPCGERLCPRRCRTQGGYFYPRSPCGERHIIAECAGIEFDISIHALLAESDTNNLKFGVDNVISIHALLAESDGVKTYERLYVRVFLSTLSLRRATACGNLRAPTVPDFYPRSPCGERLGFYADMMALTAISIHALLAESDRQRRR